MPNVPKNFDPTQAHWTDAEGNVYQVLDVEGELDEKATVAEAADGGAVNADALPADA